MTFENVEELIGYRLWTYNDWSIDICESLNITSIILTAICTGVGNVFPPVLSVNAVLFWFKVNLEKIYIYSEKNRTM